MASVENSEMQGSSLISWCEHFDFILVGNQCFQNHLLVPKYFRIRVQNLSHCQFVRHSPQFIIHKCLLLKCLIYICT